MDLDIPNLEQDKFSAQVSGVEPSTTEANNTFIPMDYDICNTITNVVDLEPAVTGSSGISMLFIEVYKNIKISNQFSLGDMH
jgi:hypothetical protein